MIKQHTEKRAETAVGILLKSLGRDWYDTGVLLDEFEETHTEYECDQSKIYGALVAGHFALKEAIDKINKQLNK